MKSWGVLSLQGWRRTWLHLKWSHSSHSLTSLPHWTRTSTCLPRPHRCGAGECRGLCRTTLREQERTPQRNDSDRRRLSQTSAQSSFHPPPPKTAFLHKLSDCWDLEVDKAMLSRSRPSKNVETIN
ncbi:hypothetical protein O3P69_019925 [Scylla paramamosain]|uniref:Uncharacterized protein n=1 Tax=Scylla paramamosain TaxID=85552 RepID=A0AAW0SIE0_SCYPA